MKFARRLFLAAGIYGLIVLVPMYFLADRLGEQDPPAITHREYYYGFLGVAIAWQVLFLIISTDPQRYRPAMLPAVIEKVTYGVAVLVLLAQGAVSGPTVVAGLIDLTLAVLFAYAFVRVGRERW